jgi:5'-nucleotidase
MKVLLTNDDGFKALGLRIVLAALKKNSQITDIKIAAPHEQQSSTSASFPGFGNWGKDEIDGVEVLWVDGTPADSVEVAYKLYGDDFDLIISGINMGTNVGNVPASGTVGAALHGLEQDMAPRAMAISWRVPEVLWDQSAANLTLDDYQDYPQQTVAQLIQLSLANDFWGAEFLNLNLPAKKPTALKFCEPFPHTYKNYYTFKTIIDHEKQTYEKVGGEPQQLEGDLKLDAVALSQGCATAVPWLSNRYVNEELLQLVGTEIKL